MTESKFSISYSKWLQDGNLLAAPGINEESLFMVSLRMCRDANQIATGSGFLWRTANGIALVTAWHNLTGLDFLTRLPLHSMGAVPNRAKFKIIQANPLSFLDIDLPLFLNAEEDQPRWFVHEKAGSHFDMAWIGLAVDRPEAFHCANDKIASIGSAVLQPGSDVIVGGFPHGIGPFGIVPIWKRGSVASPMRMPVNGMPYFLIDMAGRQGMSGGYVFGRSLPTEDYKFIGIYTGRASSPGTARESSELGMVWWNDIVEDMIYNGVSDEFPEVGMSMVKVSENSIE